MSAQAHTERRRLRPPPAREFRVNIGRRTRQNGQATPKDTPSEQGHRPANTHARILGAMVRAPPPAPAEGTRPLARSSAPAPKPPNRPPGTCLPPRTAAPNHPAARSSHRSHNAAIRLKGRRSNRPALAAEEAAATAAPAATQPKTQLRVPPVPPLRSAAPRRRWTSPSRARRAN